MMCSFTTVDEMIVRSVQQDYITAANHQRLVHSVESAKRHSVWANLLEPFHRNRDSQSRQEEARSFVRPEIQPTT